MKKVLILMTDSRPLCNNLDIADYNSLVACINYKYAERHNYKFLYMNPKNRNVSGNRPGSRGGLNCASLSGNPRHSSWSKILSTIKTIINYSDYDFLIYIDSDCIFNNFDMNVIDYLTFSKNINDKKLDLTKDIFFLNNNPFNPDLPCAGFYIAKINKNVLEFMKLWYFNEDYPNNDIFHPWEQNVLFHSIHNDNTLNTKYEVINDWMFRELEGQYLRHIGSEECFNRLPTFNQKINDMGINSITYKNIIDDMMINKLVTYDTGDFVQSIYYYNYSYIYNQK